MPYSKRFESLVNMTNGVQKTLCLSKKFHENLSEMPFSFNNLSKDGSDTYKTNEQIINCIGSIFSVSFYA